MKLPTIEPLPARAITLRGRRGEGDAEPRTNADLRAAIPELKQIADWMDSAFTIPGTNLRFGLDSLLGLVPGVGDTVTSFVSLYILHAAHRSGVPRATMMRMGLNVAIDYVIGSVPFLGDVFDVYWKSNQKNVALLHRHAVVSEESRRRTRMSDWLFFGALAAGLVALLVGSLTIAYYILHALAGMFR